MTDAPTILVIDDDETIYDIIEAAVSKLNIPIIFADNAENGIKIAQETHPSLILLDLLLPSGIKGWDIINQLKVNESTSGIPVVAFTAAGGDAIQRAMRAGAADYLTKPFRVADLQRVISQHIVTVNR